jgi:hypothetical protein
LTLILNGTDNSATTPAVTGTDTDTGVYYPAANQVALATNGTQRLLLDSSGNVLINSTTLPASLATNFRNIFVKGDNNGVVTASSNDQLCSVSMYSGANSTDVPSMLFQNGLRFGLTTDLGTGGYAEKMRVNTYGIGVGGAIPSSGTGITFPATQSASSNANTLDDYEEGTWTPTVGGSTVQGTVSYTIRSGYYTKVGRLVTVSFAIQTSSTLTGATGVVLLSGLPFTVAATGDLGAGAGSIGYANGLAVTSYTSNIYVDQNNSYCVPCWIQAASGITYWSTSTFQNNASFSGTLSYITFT